MAYSKVNTTGWEDSPSTNTPIDAANLGHMDQGIFDIDQAVNNATLTDGATLPGSNGPFGFVTLIGYILTLIKAMVGGAHWYSAPPTSLTTLNTNKANLSGGAAFTGTVTFGGSAPMVATSGLSGKFTAASSAPSSPADGDLWLDTSTVL